MALTGAGRESYLSTAHRLLAIEGFTSWHGREIIILRHNIDQDETYVEQELSRRKTQVHHG